MTSVSDFGLETKFQTFDTGTGLAGETGIAGYASLFGEADQGGDVVRRGAYARSLASLTAQGRKVKMLWQHDPAQPIGVWDEIREDERGLHVRGRILADVQRGAEALALLKAGAIDGLSIGYRTVRAAKTSLGRALEEIELWEVSLVTFPMLPSARASLGAGEAEDALARALTEAIAEARADLT
ncbi:HK97 family phage prohead protease [Oceanicella sp. SM1341]|uniref:HK97 family phage prohead protease n=1 Tax=Oceanicella sp. SM1341 TaxID=1548889 RepID=UPI000E54A026|nr:HK97 family phage prohead protease [Oceanicella sp. SM1341]